MHLPNPLGQFVSSIQQRRWARQAEADLQRWAQRRGAMQMPLDAKSLQHVVLLVEEFFHPDLRGFGGFGATVKNVAEHFNLQTNAPWKFAVALSHKMTLVKMPERREYHHSPVILRPDVPQSDLTTLDQYADLIQQLQPRAFLSIDWYPSYAVPAYASPKTPLIIWIHDPRARLEWEKIAAVAEELKFRGVSSPKELIALAEEKEVSIKNLLALSGLVPRKIVFCRTAAMLVPRAERTYGISPIHAHELPNPIALPEWRPLQESERPSLLYLGRLDAVKRPWIAFELARRNPGVDFWIAGQSHNEELTRPMLERYRDVPNLHLLGHVDGAEKERLLRNCWAILNTSAHEAQPVSFLEAFAYQKTIVSCRDADDIVRDYGFYAGEVLGDGLDEESLGRFDTQIARLVASPAERHDKAQRGYQHVAEHNSFDAFARTLERVMAAEGI